MVVELFKWRTVGGIGGGGAGVMAVCIGTETVEGVVGKGIIGITLGVLFSSSSEEEDIVVLEGVVNGVVVVVLRTAFCNISLCFLFRSSRMFAAALDFEESVEESGEKGFRAFCSKLSPPLTGLEEKKCQIRYVWRRRRDWYF